MKFRASEALFSGDRGAISGVSYGGVFLYSSTISQTGVLTSMTAIGQGFWWAVTTNGEEE